MMRIILIITVLVATMPAYGFNVIVSDSNRIATTQSFLSSASDTDSFTGTGAWSGSAQGDDSYAAVQSSFGATGDYASYLVSMNSWVESYGPEGAWVTLETTLTFSEDVNYSLSGNCFNSAINGFSGTEIVMDGVFDLGCSSTMEENRTLFDLDGVIQAGTYSILFTQSSANMGDVPWVEGAMDLDLAFSAAVPVPAAVWLFGSALAGLGWMRRKQTA